MSPARGEAPAHRPLLQDRPARQGAGPAVRVRLTIPTSDTEPGSGALRHRAGSISCWATTFRLPRSGRTGLSPGSASSEPQGSSAGRDLVARRSRQLDQRLHDVPQLSSSIRPRGSSTWRCASSRGECRTMPRLHFTKALTLVPGPTSSTDRRVLSREDGEARSSSRLERPEITKPRRRPPRLPQSWGRSAWCGGATASSGPGTTPAGARRQPPLARRNRPKTPAPSEPRPGACTEKIGLNLTRERNELRSTFNDRCWSINASFMPVGCN